MTDHEARQANKLRRLARMGAVVTPTTADYPREAERNTEPLDLPATCDHTGHAPLSR